MGNSIQSQTTAVLGTAIGGVVSVALTKSYFSPWHTVVGIILLLILVAHWRNKSQSVVERLSYAAVFSFSAVIMLGWLLDVWLPLGKWNPGEKLLNAEPRDVQMFVIWLIVSLIVLAMRWGDD